jgi:hypothetical protein
MKFEKGAWMTKLDQISPVLLCFAVLLLRLLPVAGLIWEGAFPSFCNKFVAFHFKQVKKF